jgi:hypothetical protein
VKIGASLASGFALRRKRRPPLAPQEWQARAFTALAHVVLTRAGNSRKDAGERLNSWTMLHRLMDPKSKLGVFSFHTWKEQHRFALAVESWRKEFEKGSVSDFEALTLYRQWKVEIDGRKDSPEQLIELANALLASAVRATVIGK